MQENGDYIPRQAAIKKLDHFQSHLHTVEGTHAIGVAKTLIKEIPAADVRPVVRGMWTKELHPNVRYNQYKCSICGEFSGHDSEGWIWKPNYCPNCGADMREES